VQYGPRLAVRALVEDLSQVTEAIQAGHKASQAAVLCDGLIQPGRAQHQNVSNTASLEFRAQPSLDRPTDPCVGHQHVDVAPAPIGQPSCLVEFILKVGWGDAVISPRRVLALDDELSPEFAGPITLPAASEGSVTATIVPAKERHDRLAQHLSEHGVAQLLEGVPPELVQRERWDGHQRECTLAILDSQPPHHAVRGLRHHGVTPVART
ncbi:MAG TPA: hypothetical protein VGA69_06040, partial [Nitriliruptorales bacterium]